MRHWLIGPLLLIPPSAFGPAGACQSPSTPRPIRSAAANTYLGEVSGVSVNSKGHIRIVARQHHGPAYAAAATHAGIRRARQICPGNRQKFYAWSFGHTVKVDPTDNIWVTDKGSDMVISSIPRPRPDGVRPQAEASDEYRAGSSTRSRRCHPKTAGFARSPTWPGDKAGNTFISDGYINSRVAKVDKDGNWLKSWGDRGKEPGQFNTALDRHRRQRECLRRRSRQSPDSGIRRRRKIPAPVHHRRAGAAGCQARDRQDSRRGDDGGRHLFPGLAMVAVHHAAAQPGALQLGRMARPHLQAQPRRQGAWRALPVRQAVEAVRLDPRDGVPVGERDLRRGAIELAGAEADLEAVILHCSSLRGAQREKSG